MTAYSILAAVGTGFELLARLFAAAGRMAVTSLLWAIGFTSHGPAAGSVAAKWMASGVLYGKNSLYAVLQSIAMGGSNNAVYTIIGLICAYVVSKL